MNMAKERGRRLLCGVQVLVGGVVGQGPPPRQVPARVLILFMLGFLLGPGWAPGPPGSSAGTGAGGPDDSRGVAGPGALVAQEPRTGSDPSGDEILRRMEETLFPDSYRMEMEMITVEAGGRERILELDVLYRRDTGSYMEILAPPRSRGTRFLQRDDSLWMFMPRSNARSAIRLAPRDSFQGSVFSNSDIGESSYTDDYRGREPRREVFLHRELGEVEVYVVEAVPRRPEAPYGRVVCYVTVEGFIPLHMEYYVRSGLRIKEMELTEIHRIAGRRRPVRMEMRALDEEGKVSTVWIRDLREEDAIPDRVFTQRHLTR